MAYIGTPVQQALTKVTSQSFNGTGSQTVFTLNRAVNTGEELEVFVNNVQQEPGVGKSYTATGTTLTFDAAPASGTGNVYVVYRGLAEVTRRLEHDPNAALAATTGTFSGNVDVTGAITTDGLTSEAANGTITSKASGSSFCSFTANTSAGNNAYVFFQQAGTEMSRITAYNGDSLAFSTGSGATERARIDSGGLDVTGTITTSQGITYDGPSTMIIDQAVNAGAMILRTGTNAYMRFDTNGSNERMRINNEGLITTPSQPSFRAGSAPAVSAGNAYVNYSTVEHNIGSHFNATNGRFTAPVAGRYLFTVTVGNNSSFGVDLRKNGASIIRVEVINPPAFTWQTGSLIINLAANDWVDVYTFTGSASIGLGQGGFHGHLLG
jgi:hypothetical protein